MWQPATLDNLTGLTGTFLVAGMPVVRTFPSREALSEFLDAAGYHFEFSEVDNAVRSVAGKRIFLPGGPAQPTSAEPVFVEPSKCRLAACGHNVHHIPGLRAAEGAHDRAALWQPVDLLEVQGQKVVFSTPDGVTVGYTHDPDRFAQMREYSPRWNVLCGAPAPHALGGLYRDICGFSPEPIGPCAG